MKVKKIIAILMATAMVIGVAGCSGNAETANQTETNGNKKEENLASDNAEAGDTDSAQDTSMRGGLELPVTDTPITVSIFGEISMNATTISSYNENEVYKELAERTGVTVEWEHPPMGETTKAFQLMVSSGDYTDLIITPPRYEYPGGLDQAVEDGVFLDLTEYIPQYMPNFSAMLEKYEGVRKAVTTENGRIVGFCRVPANGELQGPYGGLQIRKDWLDEVGLDVPVTYDDWTEMLRVFKEKFGCKAAFALHGNGYFNDDQMNAGFGVTNTFMKVGDEVKWGPMEEGWKEYVTLMNQWYKEGLIDPEYTTHTNDWAEVTDLATNDTGAYSSMYTMPAVYRAAIEGFECIAVQNPVKEEGQTAQARVGSVSYRAPSLFVSTAVSEEELPAILKWIDYQYSEEGRILSNYGIEGDTFIYNEAGEVEYTDKIMNNPEGKTYAQATEEYLGTSMYNWHQDWRKELMALEDQDAAMMDVWWKDGTDLKLPDLSLTEEESLEKNAIMADCETYMKEMTNKFITGIEPIEKFDEYVETLKSMGIEKAITITQAGYDRYLAK